MSSLPPAGQPGGRGHACDLRGRLDITVYRWDAGGYWGTRATQKTVWPKGGRMKRSMSRVVGTTVLS